MERFRKGIGVFDLGGGLVQVGTNPRYSFCLSGLGISDRRWLERMFRAGGLPGRSAHTPSRQHLLRLLREHSLLHDPADNPLRRLRVRVNGLDAIGISLARALLGAGVRYLDLRDRRSVDDEVSHLFPPAAWGMARTAAMADELGNWGAHLSRQSGAHVLVTVSDHVIDERRASLAQVQDLVHLPVVKGDRAVTLGPMWLPGRSACHVCADHYYCEQVPSWPSLKQRSDWQPPEPASPGLAMTAAGLAAQMIEAFATGTGGRADYGAVSAAPAAWPADGGSPADGELDEPVPVGTVAVRVSDRGVEQVLVPPHPGCLCQVSAAVPSRTQRSISAP